MSREPTVQAPWWRCALVALLVAGTAVAVTAALLPDLARAVHTMSSDAVRRVALDQWLVWLAEAGAVACLAWLSVLTALICVEAAHASRSGRPPSAHGVGPAAVRRAVLLACGAGLAVSLAAPAHATPGAGQVGAHAAAGALGSDDVLDGLMLPDRLESSSGASASPVTSRLRPAAPAASAPSGSDRVRVAPGDSLWSLAAAGLPPTASDRQITERWHAIHRLNADAIGADPDLIHPDTVLRLPRS